ncbi:hypothetical protein BC830DRAFT_1150300 [Chytriomyces sp. MP71]|nr:hypothetical protein BC830DRAFT_1150300 [Chytriomyces sp. MP71]
MSRDFRKNYYSSLGVRTVEARSTLEEALSSARVDLGLLKRICLSVKIPRVLRPLVWSLLLGGVPLFRPIWAFAQAQKTDTFEDLRRASSVLVRDNRRTEYGPDASLSSLEMVQMLRVRRHMNLIPFVVPSLSHKGSHLAAIADCVNEICDGRSEAEAFWIFALLVDKLAVAVDEGDPGEKEALGRCQGMWELVDVHAPSIIQHLTWIVVKPNAFVGWYLSFYASVMPPHCLEGLWDATLSGAPDILDYLGLSLLLASKRKVEACKTEADFMRLLVKIDDFVDVDAVSATAVDLWIKSRKPGSSI